MHGQAAVPLELMELRVENFLLIFQQRWQHKLMFITHRCLGRGLILLIWNQAWLNTHLQPVQTGITPLLLAYLNIT